MAPDCRAPPQGIILRAAALEGGVAEADHLRAAALEGGAAEADAADGRVAGKASDADVMGGGETVPAVPRVDSLDVDIDPKAREIFEECWGRLVASVGGKDNICVPREIVWLNGAPGAGKGANTNFILRTRGFTLRPIECSSLFRNDPEVKSTINSGGMVPDTKVVYLLMDALLNPSNEETCNGTGVLVDGFPRTKEQVDCLKLLHDKIMDLHRAHATDPVLSKSFPRPMWKIVVLYVDEKESIRRQLARGTKAQAHEKRFKDAGFEPRDKVRATDIDEEAMRRRYQVFTEHYGTLVRLKKFFHFHLIDAMGSLEDCKDQIAQELRYQSSLELNEKTYNFIRGIPLAHEIARQSRQELVKRLDHYTAYSPDVFKQVMSVLHEEVMPLLWRNSLAGHAEYETCAELWADTPVAVDMLVDVLSDRGFGVAYKATVHQRPVRVDMTTGEIITEEAVQHKFRIQFDRSVVRRVKSSFSTGGEDRKRVKTLKEAQKFAAAAKGLELPRQAGLPFPFSADMAE